MKWDLVEQVGHGIYTALYFGTYGDHIFSVLQDGFAPPDEDDLVDNEEDEY